MQKRLLVSLTLALSACQIPKKLDPLERLNRGIYGFNKAADKNVLKPITTVYTTIIPSPIRRGVSNFYQNLTEIPTTANSLLQGNTKLASKSFTRFTINSTFGLAGFIDLAGKKGVKYQSNDFGITLAKYGYKDSMYLVLPIFGPSTVRDGISKLPNTYLSVYPYIRSHRVRYGLLAGSFVDTRAKLSKYDATIKEAAVDEYIFIRDTSLQLRHNEIEEVLTGISPVDPTHVESVTTLTGPPE